MRGIACRDCPVQLAESGSHWLRHNRRVASRQSEAGLLAQAIYDRSK